MDRFGANGYLILLKKVVELSELEIISKLPVPRRRIHPPQFWTVMLGAANPLSREQRESDENRPPNLQITLNGFVVASRVRSGDLIFDWVYNNQI